MGDPMTTEEVRELARRWVWWNAGEADSLPKPRSTEQLGENVERMLEMCVTTEDREGLFAWVRERILEVTIPMTGQPWLELPLRLDRLLGITYTEAQDLAKAASTGWHIETEREQLERLAVARA